MFPKSLFKNVEIRYLKVDGTNYEKAAGTGDTLTSDAIDTLGYEAFSVIEVLGANSGSTSYFKLQNSADDAATDAYADIAGSKYTLLSGDAHKCVIETVYRPDPVHGRYWKVLTVRDTSNLAVNALLVILYRKHPDLPITAGATMNDVRTLVSAARGTA